MRKKPIPATGKVDYHGNYSAPIAADVEKAQSIEKDAMAYYTSYWKDDANSISYEPVVEAYCKGHEVGSQFERSKLPGLIKEVLKRAADNAKVKIDPLQPHRKVVDKQSILSVSINFDDLIK